MVTAHQLRDTIEWILQITHNHAPLELLRIIAEAADQLERHERHARG